MSEAVKGLKVGKPEQFFLLGPIQSVKDIIENILLYLFYKLID